MRRIRHTRFYQFYFTNFLLPGFHLYIYTQVVYSLGGYVGKNLKFRLVRDNNLEKAKSKLEKILEEFFFIWWPIEAKSSSFIWMFEHLSGEFQLND